MKAIIKKKQVKSPNPFDFPIDLSEKYRETEQRFSSLLEKGEFDEATHSWENLYKLFLNRQKTLGYRLHKGGIVHNLGIVALLTNNLELAFKNFMMGFAEDVASQIQEFGGLAEDQPGAQTLKSFFGVDEDLFNLSRKIVIAKLSEDKFYDPRQVFKRFWKTQIKKKTLKERIESLKKTPFVVQKKYSINQMPGEWRKRVFIGGNYSGDRVKNLFEIKKSIEKNNFIPIIALEFNDDEPCVHDHSLLLLHNCKYAIFDVSKDSGYLMEVERTFDYRTKILLVYEEIPESRMTEMISSLDIKPRQFSNSEELAQLVDKFFKS